MCLAGVLRLLIQFNKKSDKKKIKGTTFEQWWKEQNSITFVVFSFKIVVR
mgnify:FL=1